MSKIGETVCQHGTPTDKHCFVCCKKFPCDLCGKEIDKIAKRLKRDRRKDGKTDDCDKENS